MVSIACLLSTLVCAQGAFGAAPGADRAGVVHFAKSADSTFDQYSQAPSPARQAWMRAKYWRMRAYSPYFDTRTAWYARAWFYKDSYAIYPGENVPSDFYLRDAQGRKLYIWFDCGGGSCPQFAGDIGNPAYRAAWIADAVARYAQGYKGIFVDDVNMELRISDGNGNLQWPVDPRTGQHDDRGRLAPLHGRVHGADPRLAARRRDRPQLPLVRRRQRSLHPAPAQCRRPDRGRARGQRLRACAAARAACRCGRC